MASKAAPVLDPSLKPGGSLVRSVASLLPVSIVVAGLLHTRISLLFVYGSRYVAKKRRKPNPQHSIKVCDARLYSRYKLITAAFEEVGIFRNEHETAEEYSRRAAEELDEPGIGK